MKKITVLAALFLTLFGQRSISQAGNDTIVYLLTCNPGTETYSIYGHSALRIVNKLNNTDLVYNWGVFDFSTPNFAWKFAKGRLDYMLAVETMDDFLRLYFYEKRAVCSQRINLIPEEIKILMMLIEENLKPENVKYRYDFFYDDCSTRIRDLLEKSIGDNLQYPPLESSEVLTFRDMTRKYQEPYPWLMFGIDLIMGAPGDKKTTFRDRMFLPMYLQNCLTETVVRREGKMVPLLQNPEFILDFEEFSEEKLFLFTPYIVFTLIMILIIFFSSRTNKNKVNYTIDLIFYSLYSVLALMMIFFTFFTDHQQMKWNLNIMWLNPFIIFCLISMIIYSHAFIWYRIVFYLSVLFLIIHLILPQDFSSSILPLIIILIVRSSARSGFKWNPYNMIR